MTSVLAQVHDWKTVSINKNRSHSQIGLTAQLVSQPSCSDQFGHGVRLNVKLDGKLEFKNRTLNILYYEV